MAARYKGNREAIKTLRASAEIFRIQAATHWRAKDRCEAAARQAEDRAAKADAEADALEKGAPAATREESDADEIPF